MAWKHEFAGKGYNSLNFLWVEDMNNDVKIYLSCAIDRITIHQTQEVSIEIIVLCGIHENIVKSI